MAKPTAINRTSRIAVECEWVNDGDTVYARSPDDRASFDIFDAREWPGTYEDGQKIARRMVSAPTLKAENARLLAQRDALLEALRSAQAAMWDAHYGSGITAAYARKVNAAINAAIAQTEEPS